MNASTGTLLRIALLTVCFLAGAESLPVPQPDAMCGVPALVLWAWERPEQLTTLNTATTAVAVLDRTIHFTERTASVRYRQHALHVADHVKRIAVVRLEGEATAIEDPARVRLVADVVGAAQRRRISALQIDFDATISQRRLYGQLLREIRSELPQRIPLSMTALASWCAEPGWLDTLPVDEAVPMVFQMGPDGDRVRAQLRRTEPFRARLCRRSIGISTDEPVDTSAYRRIYIFSPQPWNTTSIRATLK